MLVKPLYDRGTGGFGGEGIGAPLDRHARFSRRSNLATRCRRMLRCSVSEVVLCVCDHSVQALSAAARCCECGRDEHVHLLSTTGP